MKVLQIYKNNGIEEVKNEKYKEILLIGYELFIGVIEDVKYNSESINKAIEEYIDKYFSEFEENLYHYETKKRRYRYKDLIMYTINCPLSIKNMVMKSKHIKIMPIQFYIMNKLKRICKLKDFTVVISDNNRYFIDEIENGLIIKESIVESDTLVNEQIDMKKKICWIKDGLYKCDNKEYKIY